MSNGNTIFDPHKRIKKRAPTPAEIERVKMQTLRAMASIGGENAISLLVPMLGSFLWSEHLPASGPHFDDFADELARTLSMQIETLEADAAALATPTRTQLKGNRHAWH
ncbi:MAG: hypothetical protein WCD20_10625 [Rhodomicrobium sp.]